MLSDEEIKIEELKKALEKRITYCNEAEKDLFEKFIISGIIKEKE